MSITKKSPGGRSTKNPGEEVLYHLYVEQNMTARQIADKYGVAEGTVRGWLYRANKEDQLDED